MKYKDNYCYSLEIFGKFLIPSREEFKKRYHNKIDPQSPAYNFILNAEQRNDRILSLIDKRIIDNPDTNQQSLRSFADIFELKTHYDKIRKKSVGRHSLKERLFNSTERFFNWIKAIFKRDPNKQEKKLGFFKKLGEMNKFNNTKDAIKNAFKSKTVRQIVDGYHTKMEGYKEYLTDFGEKRIAKIKESYQRNKDQRGSSPDNTDQKNKKPGKTSLKNVAEKFQVLKVKTELAARLKDKLIPAWNKPVILPENEIAGWRQKNPDEKRQAKKEMLHEKYKNNLDTINIVIEKKYSNFNIDKLSNSKLEEMSYKLAQNRIEYNEQRGKPLGKIATPLGAYIKEYIIYINTR